MNNETKAALLSLPLLLNACATAPKSVALGAAIGGVAGGFIGQNQSQNSQGTVVGLAVGAGLGALVGYLAYKDKVVKQPQNDSLKEMEERFPALTKPKLRAIWVPDKIEGNKYIRGHYIYVIEDAGSWSKD